MVRCEQQAERSALDRFWKTSSISIFRSGHSFSKTPPAKPSKAHTIVIATAPAPTISVWKAKIIQKPGRFRVRRLRTGRCLVFA